ncbi:MAG: UvrD-helicase domain-containing protein [Candidatus Hydrogenedens sp.]|nr:UvrD-helicase domain-containing protein [Candidatus Hydrogenedentota bacterium]NLF57272.1 UvrD-helicase domain-containing protein [Candidatus Hydrogenedens sp.]
MTRTEEQNRAVTTDARRVCVDAGAGSGKTAILVDRVVHLLENPRLWPDREPRLDGIVAFTFMEKAAAEMKSRLRAAFHRRAPEDDREKMTHWRELERNVDAARVSTIHGFCAGLLRENALLLGFDPDVAVLGEAESLLLSESVTADTLHRLLEEEGGAAFELFVEIGGSRLKTALKEVLRRRALFRRVTEGLSHENPATLLAAWRARCAEEHARRLRELPRSVAFDRLRRELRALDGFCDTPGEARESRRRAALAVLDSIADGGLTEKEIQAGLESLLVKDGLRGNAKRWADRESFDKADDLVQGVKELARNITVPFGAEDPELEERAARAACAFVQVAGEVIAAYQEAKRRLGCMDFDDQIEEAFKALREHPELRARTAAGIAHLLVDEFQDTDQVQLDIARLLAGEPGGPALFVVGDAKQSIYLFRGAEVEVFRREQEGAEETIPLRVNFRSAPDVLGFINNFFMRSKCLNAVEDYAGMKTHRPAMGGARVEFFVTPPTEEGKAPSGEAQREAEAAFVAARIREMVEGPEPLMVQEKGSGGTRPAAYGDIAVLFRAATHTHYFEEALRDCGVPYCLVAGGGFYERREVLDVLALLKVVTDPWDEAALVDFLRSPAACLTDDSLLCLRMAGGVARVFNGDTVPDGFGQADRLARARELVVELRGCRELPPGTFLRRAIARTGMEAMLLGQHQGLQKVSNIRKLAQAADSFADRLPARLGAFVRYLDEVRSGAVREGEANLQAGGGNAVSIMTVHKSKGLEFPVVFLPEMALGGRRGGRDKLLMHRSLGLALPMEDDEGNKADCMMAEAVKDRILREEEAESARTLYVAMTRARDYLVLCGGPKARQNTWFFLLDQVYGVSEKAHLDTVEGKSWRAVVRREIPAAVPGSMRPASETVPELDRLRALMGSVEPGPVDGRTFSVTALLNWMERCADEEQEARPEPDEEKMGEPLPHAQSAPDRDFAMARGTLAHRLFECWDFAGDNAGLPETLLREARLGLEHMEPLRAQLEKMADLFRQNPLHARLKADAGLRRELPFHLVLDGVVLRGTIDALLGDGAVLDYKTGAPSPDKAPRYQTQLALYAEAVRQIAGHAPEEGLVYYVDRGELHPVEFGDDVMAETLERARRALREMRGGERSNK